MHDSGSVWPFSVEPPHPDISVAHELFRKIPAPVHLQGDASFVRVPLFLLGPFHEFHPIDPGGNGGWIVHNPRSKLVPLGGAPEICPGIYQNWHGDRPSVRFNPRDLIQKSEVADARFAAETFPI